jgi:glycosyltransferase involved in cell wall biosynthesis
MINTKITVIIPVYNTEIYLHKCLNSIVNQNYKNLEIIIVNDGSTDGSKNIIDDYAKIDSRIIVLHKENGGIGSALKAAFKIMTGDYIAFVDSDDFISLNMFSDLIIEIKKTNPDMIHFGKEFIDILGNSISKVKPENITYTKSIDNILNEHFEKIKDPSLACRIFRKELFENVVLLNQNIGIDEILYPQLLLKSTSILHIPTIFYYVLIRPTSVSRANYTLKKIEEYITVHRFICELFEKNYTEYAFHAYMKYLNLALPVYEVIVDRMEYSNTEVLNQLKNDIKLNYSKLKFDNKLTDLKFELFIKLKVFIYLPSFYSLIYNMFWFYKGIKSKFLFTK